MPFGSNMIDGQVVSEFVNNYRVELILLAMIIIIIRISWIEKNRIDSHFQNYFNR